MSESVCRYTVDKRLQLSLGQPWNNEKKLSKKQNPSKKKSSENLQLGAVWLGLWQNLIALAR